MTVLPEIQLQCDAPAGTFCLAVVFALHGQTRPLHLHHAPDAAPLPLIQAGTDAIHAYLRRDPAVLRHGGHPAPVAVRVLLTGQATGTSYVVGVVADAWLRAGGWEDLDGHPLQDERDGLPGMIDSLLSELHLDQVVATLPPQDPWPDADLDPTWPTTPPLRS